MARIAGINIPTKKACRNSADIHSWYRHHQCRSICDKAGITQERRINDLTEDELSKLRDIIDADYLVEGDLRRKTSMDVKRYLDLRVSTWLASSPESACPGSAYTHECTDAQRSSKGNRR